MVGGLQPGDPQWAGPYRLLGRLGNGGMGQVFLGKSVGGRPVAVKVIRADLAGDANFRMTRQAHAQAGGQPPILASDIATATAIGPPTGRNYRPPLTPNWPVPPNDQHDRTHPHRPCLPVRRPARCHRRDVEPRTPRM